MHDAQKPFLEIGETGGKIRLAECDHELAGNGESLGTPALRQPEDQDPDPAARTVRDPVHGERWAVMIKFNMQQDEKPVTLKSVLENVSACTPSSANRAWHFPSASKLMFLHQLSKAARNRVDHRANSAEKESEQQWAELMDKKWDGETKLLPLKEKKVSWQTWQRAFALWVEQRLISKGMQVGWLETDDLEEQKYSYLCVRAPLGVVEHEAHHLGYPVQCRPELDPGKQYWEEDWDNDELGVVTNQMQECEDVTTEEVTARDCNSVNHWRPAILDGHFVNVSALSSDDTDDKELAHVYEKNGSIQLPGIQRDWLIEKCVVGKWMSKSKTVFDVDDKVSELTQPPIVTHVRFDSHGGQFITKALGAPPFVLKQHCVFVDENREQVSRRCQFFARHAKLTDPRLRVDANKFAYLTPKYPLWTTFEAAEHLIYMYKQRACPRACRTPSDDISKPHDMTFFSALERIDLTQSAIDRCINLNRAEAAGVISRHQALHPLSDNDRPGDPSLHSLRQTWVFWWRPKGRWRGNAQAGHVFQASRMNSSASANTADAIAPLSASNAAQTVPRRCDEALTIVEMHELEIEWHESVRVSARADDVVGARLSWLSLQFRKLSRPFVQPFGAIRNYFGTEIAMYFAWLGFYTAALVLPAAIGIYVSILHDSDRPHYPLRRSAKVQAGFCVFILLWSILFNKFWRREQACIAMKWGTTGYELRAPIRPQFCKSNFDISQRLYGTNDGGQRPSPVHGHLEIFFPPAERLLYKALSFVVLVASIVTLCFIFLSILDLRADWADPTSPNYKPWGGYACSVLQGLSIQILQLLFLRGVDKFVDLENYRTDIEFEDAKIFKVFTFSCCNQFGAVFYTAFFKEHSHGCVNPTEELPRGDCMLELKSLIYIIFAIRMLTNILELGWPLLKVKKEQTVAHDRVDPQTPGTEEKLYEALVGQAELVRYDDTLSDYAEMTLQFGFVTMFLAACPLLPLLALVENLLEMRVDAYKLCVCVSRPYPSIVEDIGTWGSFLLVMSVLSILTNAGLMVFTSHDFEDFELYHRFVIFFATCFVLFAIAGLLWWQIGDVPDEVETQKKRSHYFNDRYKRGIDLFDAQDRKIKKKIA